VGVLNGMRVNGQIALAFFKARSAQSPITILATVHAMIVGGILLASIAHGLGVRRKSKRVLVGSGPQLVPEYLFHRATNHETGLANVVNTRGTSVPHSCFLHKTMPLAPREAGITGQL
jgi:hypothetical protein